MTTRWSVAGLLAGLGLIGPFVPRASAAVARVEITGREDLFAGKRFGNAGGYEKITAKIYYALDPANPHNRVIVDLDRAPRNGKGAVEFTADVMVVRPKEHARANGALLLDIPNRGGSLSWRGTLEHQGDIDTWYLRQGYTLASIGWQFDVREGPGLLRLAAPVARGITGRVRADFVVVERTNAHTVSHVIQDKIGGSGYRVAGLAARDAVLTERDEPLGDRRTIPRESWRFTDDFTLTYDGGFVPGRIYEVVYTASDPAVVGVGLAAVRDFTDYCKHDPTAIAVASRVYGFGISQTGRLLRHLVYQGFNASESGQQVFDGLLVYVAGAGRGSFNHRFAQPSRDSQAFSPLLYPNDVFPFTDLPTTDQVTGQREGLLDRARAEGVIPKIFYINTAYEYWSRGASLIHTTPDATADVDLPEEVRIYFLAGIGHVPGPFPPGHRPIREIVGQHPENPNSYAMFRRALLAALDAWVQGERPPDSRYPRLADHTLAALDALAVKKVQGVGFPREAYRPYQMELGPEWPKGITAEPPRVVGTYPTLLPQVRPDGNEMAGVHRPEIDAPLATYTGWNLRDAKTGFAGGRTSFIGSYIAWPRAQLLSRYRTADDYVGAYAGAAVALVRQRFLVPDDLPDLLDGAIKQWQFATSLPATATRTR
jgi:hypothetical protein